MGGGWMDGWMEHTGVVYTMYKPGHMSHGFLETYDDKRSED